MKKTIIVISVAFILLAFGGYRYMAVIAGDDKNIVPQTPKAYQYPEFYKGIYLTVDSARNLEKLKDFVEMARQSSINTIVMDVQSFKGKLCTVPRENVEYCIQNGIHPIARVVCFPDGLKVYPLPEGMLDDRLSAARSSCESGFREIQFDYIRFNDSGCLTKITLAQRYAFVEGILLHAREQLSKYNVKIAADIFGRIPLNRGDVIGQRMEGLDEVVDIICPMAYPSHYWTRKMQHSPYDTVYKTSKEADNRTKKAEIVTYIQAFKMKMPPDMSFSKYIQEQIRAVHDANIKGFILWNARQDYAEPLRASREYYEKNKTAGNTSPKKNVM